MKFFSPIRRLAAALAWSAAASCALAAGGQPGPALHDLAPIRLYSVPEVEVGPPVPLPDPAEAPSGQDALPPEQGIPDISYDFFWDQGDSRKWRAAKVSSASPGLRGTSGRGRAPGLRAPWLSAPSKDPWTFGASNWRYTGEQGLGITLGTNEITVPAWGNTARIGGVSVSQSSQLSSGEVHAWQYSMSVGALDYSPSQTQGDLVYGPTASNTMLRYRLSPQFTLESQLEMAPQLVTTGVGGRYTTRGWGAWSAGLAKANHGMQQGWRYQAAYEVDVLDDLKLSWLNESHTAGFADLSRYQDAAASLGGVRQRLTATVPLGRWGDLAGMYENSRSTLGDTQRSFGFTQQFWYSPNLRIGLQAERQLVTGDYDVGIRFSVPIN
ncbi:hypothetical protein [Pollutimonas bauzanensis]|uniref:MetA-pathway of phenol degradation n=1 Tax=Pollutimonas bauzanensis TaxID=658167 RepID=A0A1M5X1T4_9BURK|nr:hypothetical protein [Pollutimonas bauzanensis]SHH93434.1 hypothetical protein SAMN04488135_10680 [Pollutimonas bauzanensis]